MQVVARSGGGSNELDAPELPGGALALWEAFGELYAHRQQAGMGAAGITYADLAAWQQLAGVDLTPWEAETLMAMDIAARTEAQNGN